MQLLQVTERNWVSTRSREERSAGTCAPSHVSSGWTSLSALQTLARDPPLLVGAARCGEAAGETGLGLGESREEISMLCCPFRPAVILL